MSKASPKLFVLLLVLVLYLPACSMIKEPKPLNIVTLRTLQMAPSQCATPVFGEVVVRTPNVPGSLHSDRIAMLFDDREIRYLAGAKWETPVQMLIRRHLLHTLDATNCFSGVGSESEGLTSPYRLLADLQRLHLCFYENDTIPFAEIVLRLSILDVKQGKILDAKTITFREKSKGVELEQMMDAMDKVVSFAMQDGAHWTVSALSGQRAESAK